jgi:hypothetical protein
MANKLLSLIKLKITERSEDKSALSFALLNSFQPNSSKQVIGDFPRLG